MIQVTIKKQDVVTNSASFPSQEEAQAWYDSHLAMGSFGTPASSHTIQVESTPAVLSEDGSELVAATFEEQVVHVSGHTVEFLDISAQLEQETINQQARQYLADTDWYVIRSLEGTPVPSGILTERALARSRII